MQKINIGFPIDLEKLIETRLLIQANSGGGKSYLLRKFMEQIHGLVPFIVIDLEGEFVTLREKFDVIIMGKGHDIPLNVEHADKIARYLLELRATAILDLSEMKKPERMLFVKLFLESMMDAPKSLWHPTVVIIDEAHQFCPEGKEKKDGAIAAEAVVDLCTRGRKRGYCAVLATQRISSLRKGAIAQVNNKLIGRTTLDTDVKRTAFELGMTNNDAQRMLSQLDEGEFYTYGAAISKKIEKHKITPVKTTHVTIGMRFGKVAPPSNAVQKLIDKISDIPKEVNEEKDTVKRLQDESRQQKSKIFELEKKIKHAPAETKIVQDKSAEIKLQQVIGEKDKVIKQYKNKLSSILNSSSRLLSAFEGEQKKIVSECLFVEEKVQEPIKATNKLKAETNTAIHIPHIPHQRDYSVSAKEISSNGTIGKCERNILIALAQRGKPSTKNQTGILAGYAITSGSFNNSLSRLRTSGYIKGGNESMVITEGGLSALGHYDSLPNGVELQRYWISELGKAESAILKVLIDNFPNEISKEQIAEACDYEVTSGSFNNSLSKLRTLELAEGRKEIKASNTLFE